MAGDERVRVLVISEDVKERLRAVSALLLDEDTEVVEAATGDEARALLFGDAPFDVLVVDGDLQPRGGYALLYDLRSRAELEGADPVPSIVLAAREQDRWLAAWAGASDLLLKPVDPFELLRQLPVVAERPPPPYGDAGSTEGQVRAAVAGHG